MPRPQGYRTRRYFTTAEPLMTEFIGFQTDPPVDQMPRGFARRMQNFLPNGVAPAQARSAHVVATGVITLTAGHVGNVSGLVWAPTTLAAGPTLDYTASLFMVLDDMHNTAPLSWDTKVYSATVFDGATVPTSIGTIAGACVIQPPVYHRDLVIICPEATTNNTANVRGSRGTGMAVKKATRAALASLGGSPPVAFRCASWGEYLILGNSDANPRRLWFSAVGAPETWDTTNGIVDVPEEVTAIMAKGNLIFVFGPQYVHLLVGDTPPPGGNLTLKKYAFRQGCADPRAVTAYKDCVIWGNANGVFKSDGSQPVDITRAGGISSFWQYIVGSGTGLQRMVLCSYLNYLFAYVLTTNYEGVLVCDLDRNIWHEWIFPSPNKSFYSMVTAPSDVNSQTRSELYVGPNGTQVQTLAACFLPAESTGGAFPYVLTGAMKLGSDGYKRFRRVYVKYAGNTGTGSTFLKLFASLNLKSDFGNPGNAGLDIAQFGTLGFGATGQTIRGAAYLNKKAETLQIALNIDTGGTLDDFKLYSIEAEVDPLDPTLDGDSRA